MLDRCLVVGLLTWAGCLLPLTAAAQSNPPAAAAGEARAADRAAIAESFQSLRKAFAARDGQAVAAHWTAEGEYENDSGVSLKGSGAIGTAFASFFAKTPELKLESEPGQLQFVGKDTAVSEGKVGLQRGPALPMMYARYSALIVREEGKWRLARLSETAVNQASLQELNWLEGEWKSVAGEKAEVRTVYSWLPGRKFLRAQFTIKETDQPLALTGQQIIGVQPSSGLLHSWTFEADGGVGDGVWERDGEHWVIQSTGTLTDGSELIQTNILRRISDDLFTWQSVYRTLDGEKLADLPPVKISRVKSNQ